MRITGISDTFMEENGSHMMSGFNLEFKGPQNLNYFNQGQLFHKTVF